MAEKPNRSPEQIDPKALDSAKNGPDPKFQELLKKQKEFIHELALNKSPAVQKFLKLWFKMNVDYRSYGHSRNPDYRSYGASRLKVGRKDDDRIEFQSVSKDENGQIIPNYFYKHAYGTRFEMSEFGDLSSMRIIYNKNDDTLPGDYFKLKGKGLTSPIWNYGAVIEVDVLGNIRIYESEKHGVSERYRLESDTSKMKLLSFDDVHTNTFLDEFNKKYENRKKIHSEYKLTDDKERVEADKKRQDEELDKIKF